MNDRGSDADQVAADRARLLAQVESISAPFASPGVGLLQFPTPGLGDNSYLLHSDGQAVVVDPQRDVDRFRTVLHEHSLRLVAVLETHVHNDYLSGGPALAGEYGADYLVPAEAGYTLAHRPLREADEVPVGALAVRALHTPGHTPHHLAYAIVDAGEVRAVLSGGSVLVGACGRTDLVAPELTDSLTREQYRSAQRLGRLPDQVAIGPTHGAGSFCAASAVSDDTWTTVSREHERNPAFLARDEDEFVRTQLAGLTAYPTYYREMAPINRGGAATWEPSLPARLSPEAAEAAIGAGAILVDARPRHEFAREHVPGAYNIELEPQFSGYLGWLFPSGTRFVVALDPEQDAADLVRQCARVGIETIEGVVDVASWKASGREMQSSEIVDMDGLHRAMECGGVRILDVRQDTEWREGHIRGAVHVHVVDLPRRAPDLAGEAPVYTYCQSGFRASMAASILQAAGVTAVAVDGGFPDWRSRGYPVE